MGQGHTCNGKSGYDQINQGQDPGPDGNDEENGKSGIRIAGSIAKQQAQMQAAHHIAGIEINGRIQTADGDPAKSHSENIHQDNAGKIVKIEPQRTPGHFQRTAQSVGAVEHNQREEKTSAAHCKDIAEQPPNLTFQNGFAVKTKNIVYLRISQVSQACYNGRTNNNIQHQIGDTLVAVFQAKPVKLGP